MRRNGRSHRAILVSLGTNAEVGVALEVDKTTVSYWKGRGIPAIYWPALVRLAALRGIALDVEELEAGSPSRKTGRLCAA